MLGYLQPPNWEVWIVLYFFVGGIAGGAYFVSALVDLFGGREDRPIVRIGYYLSLPLVLLSALFLIVDLGRPERFFHMIFDVGAGGLSLKLQSPMSTGAYALFFFGVFSFLAVVDALIEEGRLPWQGLRRAYQGPIRTVLVVLGGLFGLYIATYTGVLLSVTHLPLWANSPLLGALFGASAVSTGLASIALILVAAGADPGASWDKLKRADNWAIVLEAVFLVLLLLTLGSAATALLQGTSALLLALVVLAGLALPLVLHLIPGMARGSGAIATTALLVLVGGLLLRTVIVLGGQGLL
jgi:formate-dependent nitrite reductase membrane component NrfD